MFERKITTYLEKWKGRKKRKPLVIRGSRQVGKSTTVREFAKSYTQYIELNLEKEEDANLFRNYGDDVGDIFNAILLSRNLIGGQQKSLLFIDEIQEELKAIALLRYFYEDLPAVHVIAAGSLLELAMGEVSSFPVGRVEQIALHPMDFEEFLMAMGENAALQYYHKISIPDFAFDKLLKLYNEYIIIGGMPEIIAAYKENGKSLPALQHIYSSIWDNYVDDIEKYGKNKTEKRVLRHIISAAPSIRDRITFAGFGQSSYSSREVSEAFRKLDKAGLIRLIYPTSDVKISVMPILKRKPRIQFLDTGLLNYAGQIQFQALALQDLNALYKGYIVNHITTQQMIALAKSINYRPHFWTRENANANAEVDLVFAYKQLLIPIEIKSGASGRLRSLHEFMDRCEHDISVRLLANTFSIEQLKTRKGKKFQLINIPYFSIGNLAKYLDYVIDGELS